MVTRPTSRPLPRRVAQPRIPSRRQRRVEQRVQWQRKFLGENLTRTPGLPSLRTKIKQKTHEFRSQIAMGRGLIIPSSWIRELSYDSTTQEVILGTSIGKRYRYKNVNAAIFTQWREGNATCKTEDHGKRKRWWIGKTPSLGAFYNKFIKGKYQMEIL